MPMNLRINNIQQSVKQQPTAYVSVKFSQKKRKISIKERHNRTIKSTLHNCHPDRYLMPSIKAVMQSPLLGVNQTKKTNKQFCPLQSYRRLKTSSVQIFFLSYDKDYQLRLSVSTTFRLSPNYRMRGFGINVSC